MRTMIMTSSKFTGQLVFEYNEYGDLQNLNIEAMLSPNQRATLAHYLPWTISEIDKLRAASKHATFTFQDREVTFEMFWNRYNDKARSSKKKTEAAWNKLSKADQVKAYLYIPTYLMYKGTAEKKYATTYLHDELWNN